ncbi:sugar ABC transporter substrate-binding protein [Modestobacter muralis]|nr:extracellular solute-binding protein [Modestobacter muralis]
MAITAVALATTAAACGGGDSGGVSNGDASSESGGSASNASAGDLLIWTGTGPQGEAIQQIAEGFGEENGVNVEVELIPGTDLQANFITASQGNNAPDVVFGAHDWIGNLVQNGSIDPIQLPATVKDDLQPKAVEAMTYNGQVYGMPFTFNNLVLYRNTALAPDAPATVEDMVAAGKALQADGKVAEVVAWPVGQTGNPYFIQPLYTAGGGYLFGTGTDGGLDKADVGVAKPEAVASYQKIGALGEKGENVLKRSISTDNHTALFTEGKSAYMVSGPWDLPTVDKAGIEYQISAIPGFAGGAPATPFITVDGTYVASKGKNKTLAQEFVTNYWSRSDIQTSYQEKAQVVPASQGVLEAIRGSQPRVAQSVDIGAANGQIMPSFPFMAGVFDSLGKAEAAVVSGADPAATIAGAATAIQDVAGG